MWISKTEKRYLQERADLSYELQSQIVNLEKQIWCLKNPPKFKKGDIIAYCRINNAYVCSNCLLDLYSYTNQYDVFNMHANIYETLTEEALSDKLLALQYREHINLLSAHGFKLF
jgi:hypothetical protein